MIFEIVEYFAHKFFDWEFTRRYITSVHKNHHLKYIRKNMYDYTVGEISCSFFQQTLITSVFLIYMRFDPSFFECYVMWSIFMYNLMHAFSHTNAWPLVRQYHRCHHICSQTNIGVSSPLCDWIFGTLHKNFIVTNKFFLFLPPPFSFLGISYKKHC